MSQVGTSRAGARRSARASPLRRWLYRAGIAVLVLLPLMTSGSLPPALSGGTALGAAPSPGALWAPSPLVGHLDRGLPIATTPSTFWSLDAQTSCARCLWTSPSVRSYLNQTPFTWVRYGENLDSCNITTDTLYGPN